LPAIREPWIKRRGAGYFIRVDSPADIADLSLPSSSLPSSSSALGRFKFSTHSSSGTPREETPDQLKARGNREFLERTYEKAAATYTRALLTLVANGGDDSDGRCRLAAVLLLNRAGAWLRLKRYNFALRDAEAALERSAYFSSPQQTKKAHFRRASALYGLSAYQRALDVLDSLEADDEVSRLADRARARLSEERTGCYDWRNVYVQCTTCDLPDVAEYVGPLDVREVPGRGRGLVATRDVEPGELLLVARPVAVAAGMGGDPAPVDVTVGLNLASGQLDGPAQVELPRVVMREALYRPELARALHYFYAGEGVGGVEHIESRAALDARPESSSSSSEQRRATPAVELDSARIERVCTYNSFTPRSIARGLLLDDDDEDSKRRAQAGGNSESALYLLPSMMNSHCLSNATYVFFGSIFVLRARVRIACGDEVMSSYVNPLEPFPVRKKHLEKYFSSDCECDLCKWDREDGERRVAERVELSKRRAALEEEVERRGRTDDELRELVAEVEELIGRLRTYGGDDESRIMVDLYPAYRLLSRAHLALQGRSQAASAASDLANLAFEAEGKALESLGARIDLPRRPASLDDVPTNDSRRSIWNRHPAVGEQDAIFSCLHLAQLAKTSGNEALSR
jgi:tetratricopeptide (TPR) repeat protein